MRLGGTGQVKTGGALVAEAVKAGTADPARLIGHDPRPTAATACAGAATELGKA